MSWTGVETGLDRHWTRYVLAVNIESGGRSGLAESPLHFDEAARVWFRFLDPDVEVSFDVVSDAG